MSQISRLRDAEISNGNLINADDIDAELNQLVSESNSQDTRLTTIESSAMTIAGVKTFSSAPKTDQIDERTLNAGVTISSVLHKSGAITLAGTAGYTPVNNGDLGYDSTSNSYKVMENGAVKTLHTSPLSVTSKSATYTAVATDKGKLFLCTSTFTLNVTAAATLGAGWYCQIRNDGTGIITIDPNASETIDGQTTMTVYPGETFTVVCDGSNFKTVGRPRGMILLQNQTASNVTSVDFTSYINSDFNRYVLECNNVVAATAGQSASLRVSEDGGSTWKSGSSDYTYAGVAGYSNGTTAANGGSSTGLFLMRDTTKNVASDPWSAIIDILDPSVTDLKKQFRVRSTAARNSDGLLVDTVMSGTYNTTGTAINGIRILMGSGNITSGTFKLYGVRK